MTPEQDFVNKWDALWQLKYFLKVLEVIVLDEGDGNEDYVRRANNGRLWDYHL